MTMHYPPPMNGVFSITLLNPPLIPLRTAPAPRPPAMSANNLQDSVSGAVTVRSHAKATRPMWMIDLDQAAKRVRALQPGWDGPRSGVVAESLIRRAVAIVSAALLSLADPVTPYLMPAGDGSLQIEWDRMHAKLEFCLEPDGSLDFWSRDLRTGGECEAEGAEALALFRLRAPWAAQRTPHADYGAAQEDLAFFELAA